ncbi:filamentous hemagglutinin N-terminal domain-containing protein [Azoarcus indigens]|uniref:Filamentous hemagglutinin family protein n=1 Tax=Azoarcus indigens TaxID=29545 RepID=A0A4R6ED12_9RHOO|nr:filamentous hemagglutinin N-terminal domain-containing protein [Azoarcus indigens]NMG67052.1 filamentous hemagglutinin N-terminal domain-containing protein [Azoarcus indigens]TDN56076.1 filamentous hemagglutinin family protein [Azoarcus indigens]
MSTNMQKETHPAVRVFRLNPVTQALAGVAAAIPALAFAQMPTGGNVVSGGATITAPDANHTVIQQTTGKAIINWDSFSIGQNGYVQFIQPGSSAIALNRVVGADPSSILGNLSANGQVFLVNPNGIFFGAGAVVNVAGIVATTLNISDADFLAGNYRFVKGGTDAKVVNAGTINAGNGGYVVLAGDYVSNASGGVVDAQLGTALLASGNALTLELEGNSLVRYAVDEATVAHLAGVDNAGSILANGGRVIMTAKVAGDLASMVVNNTGLVQAQSTVERDGIVYLVGEGGSVANAGKVDVSAQAGAKGGHVDIVADGDIVHAAGSVIDISGAATGNSSAGSVYTWADGTNRFNSGATIVGKGGAEGGNGGFVELSGNKVVYRGLLDLTAVAGTAGWLLVDPTEITIKSGSGTGDAATFYETDLESALAGTSNVVLQASNTGAGNTASITMEALSDGELTGTGTAGLTLAVNAQNGATGSITFQNKSDTINIGGDLVLSVTDGNAVGAGAGVGTIDVGNLTSKSNIDLTAGSIATRNLTVANSAANGSNAAYAINADATTGDLTVDGDVSLIVSNTSAAGVKTSVDLQAAGAVNITGNLVSSATGVGYYHYNYTTPGSAATSYYSTYADRSDPWTLVDQGDHKIESSLNVAAGGNLSVGGTTTVTATDNNTAFTGGNAGGYFQTATSTTHNFWRPTAATATANVTAGGDVSLGGLTTVKADGYATASYGEVESWNDMVLQYNYTTRTQTVSTGCNPTCTSYDTTINNVKGSATGQYVWSFNYNDPPLNASYSPYPNNQTDSHGDSASTQLGYSGQTGVTASLNVNAGGSVTTNGLDVAIVNRSSTGSTSYSDANWGHQDSSNVGATVSGAREVNYSDSFSRSWAAARSTATTTISSGDNQAVTLNGNSNTSASFTEFTPLNTALAGATMTVTAGQNGGNSGSGNINVNGNVTVSGGDSTNPVALTLTSLDGNVVQAPGTSITVNNSYTAGDADATLEASAGSLLLQSISVAAGHNAQLTGTALDDITVAGTLTAHEAAGTNNSLSRIALQTTDGDITLEDAVRSESAVSAVIDVDAGRDLTVNGATSAVADGAGNTSDWSSTNASITFASGGDMTINGTTTVDVDAASYGHLGPYYPYYNYPYTTITSGVIQMSSGGDLLLNNTVTATANSVGYNGTSNGAYTGNATTSITISSDGNLTVNDVISATSGSTSNATAVGGDNFGSTSASVQLSSDGATEINAVVRSDATSITNQASATTVVGGGNLLTLNEDVLATGVSAATVTLNSTNAGGEIVQLAGKTARAQAASATANVNTAATGSVDLRSVQALGGTSANLAMNVGSGTVDVLTSTASAGTATATLTTQDADGTLTLADSLTVTGNRTTAGESAALVVNAAGGLDASSAVIAVSNNSTTASTAARAQITAGGSVTLDDITVTTAGATGSGSTAGLILSAGDATVTDFTVSSDHGAASASFTTTSGDLTLNGIGRVYGNGVGTFAGLSASVAGDLDTSAASLEVRNQSTLSSAHANATLAATGTATISDLSVSSDGTNGAVTVNLSGADGLTVSGEVTATSLATGGTATVSLGSADGSVNVLADALVLANSHGFASLSSGSATGGVLDGVLWANSTNNGALLSVEADGGTLSQGAAGALRAESATVSLLEVHAGDSVLDLNGTLRAVAASGSATLDLIGASGSVGGFEVSSASGTASAFISGNNAAGTLVLDGSGTVSGNSASSTGALLSIATVGALDASAATLNVANTGTSNGAGVSMAVDANGNVALGQVDLAAAGANGLAELTVISNAGNVSFVDEVNVTGNGTASNTVVEVTAAGNLLVGNGAGISASAPTGNASVTLAAGGNATINGDVEANALASAEVSITGTTGVAQGAASSIVADGDIGSVTLSGAGVQVAGLVKAAALSGSAEVTLVPQGGDITVAQGGQLLATSSTGGAFVTLDDANRLTLNGAVQASSQGSQAKVSIDDIVTSLTQGANGTIGVTGRSAELIIDGSGTLAGIDLGGSQTLLATQYDATLNVTGGQVRVANFDVRSLGASARVSALASNGLVFNGTGVVIAQGQEGAIRGVAYTGNVDTRSANLSATNSGTGAAEVGFGAVAGSVLLGNAAALAGSGTAALSMAAQSGIEVSGNVLARANGGNSHVQLITIGETAHIKVASGATVVAESLGSNAGDADIYMKAGDCCKAQVQLDGNVTASTAGNGDATLAAYAGRIAVNGVTTAHSVGGSAGIGLATAGDLIVTGKLVSKADSANEEAHIVLVSDKLNYSGTAELSQGNGRVQLAPFSTNKIIGVNSARDHDAIIGVNYTTGTLNKFAGYGAEIRIGGSFDRSNWANGSDWCIPDMANWTDVTQHTADIHVAGSSNIVLASTAMVFDTTGITYYHDQGMSPWSVPNGRTAIYVPRAEKVSIDRYVDRTDNSLHTVSRAPDTTLALVTTGIPPEGTTPLGGNLFLAGDGVNMGVYGGAAGAGQNGAGSGSGANGGGEQGGGANADDDENRRNRGQN